MTTKSGTFSEVFAPSSEKAEVPEAEKSISTQAVRSKSGYSGDLFKTFLITVMAGLVVAFIVLFIWLGYSINERLAKTEAIQSETIKKLSEFKAYTNERFNLVDKRLDRLETKMDRLETKMGRMETR